MKAPLTIEAPKIRSLIATVPALYPTLFAPVQIQDTLLPKVNDQRQNGQPSSTCSTS